MSTASASSSPAPGAGPSTSGNAPAPRRLGIDFDNTIVCYDALFHRVAREGGWIPADLPANKSDVRNHLRAIGREDVWTEMQGRVYGARMNEADPYPGVLEFFLACRRSAIPVFIVSHKTRRPFAGEPYDLHAAARGWLETQGFHDPARLGLPTDRVFFELTKADKLARIGALGCTHFIDDLPEFLAEADFPAPTTRILFDPNRLYADDPRFPRLLDWSAAPALLGLPEARPAPTATAAPDATPAPVPGLDEFTLETAAGGARSVGPSRQATMRMQFPFHPPGDGGRFPEEIPSEAAATERSPPTAVSKFTDFLRAAGLPQDAVCESLPGGANNRVFRVRSRAGGDFVLKRYFHADTDPRDRFGAEHAFYRWIQDHGIRRTPEPVAWDATRRLGLFRFVDGRKLAPGEVDGAAVAQAIAFVAELNAPRLHPAAAALPVASEACFSIAEHLGRIGRRVERLLGFVPESELDREAAAFARDQLSPAWQALRRSIESVAAPGGELDEPLPVAARCLSPSDFGFHNALLAADGQLRFFDFEYAGWDDPAKTVGDFFCQPQVPVDPVHWPAVVGAWDRALGGQGGLEKRARLLFPAYRIKWCCIVLNEFLRGDQARRAFAQGADPAESRKRAQLDKARHLLAAVPLPPA